MKTVAVLRVKDEADIIEGTLRHTADEVDYLFVADNGSTDGTRELLDMLTEDLPLIVVDDPEVAYLQSERMSALAEQAVEETGAQWVLPVDADELWVAPHRIGDVLAAQTNVNVAAANLHHHLRTALDVTDLDPFRSMVWRQREPAPMQKVAFRWQPGAIIKQGNHGVTFPSGGSVSQTLLDICHFPVRSAEHMISKARNGAAAYNATDLPWVEGQHWRAWGLILEQKGERGLYAAYHKHWFYDSPVDAGLIHELAPYRRWVVKDDPTNGAQT